jgi:primosomal protein N'
VQKIAKIVVEDFPFFNNAFFSYAIPTSLEQSLTFGSLVQVPFGLSNSLRLGIVVELAVCESQQIKEIHALLSQETPLTQASLSFLMLISYSYFYPLSLLFKMAGIFPPRKSIRVFYEWTEAFLSEIKTEEQSSTLVNYVTKHPLGFYEDLLQKKMQWKKNSSAFKKIKEAKNTTKTFHVSYPPFDQAKNKPSFSGIVLLNLLNSEQRFKWLESEMLKQELHNVLLIVPTRQKEMLAKSYFESSLCKSNLVIKGKHGLLHLEKKYSLIFIEDCLHMSYSWDMPFSYPLDKTAFFRSQETGEAMVLASYIPGLSAFQQLQLKQIAHICGPKTSTMPLVQPKLSILSMNKETHEHGYAVVPFTILRKIEQYLKCGKKVFLLHNRKGYYNYLMCKNCGYVAKCPKCQIVQSVAPSQDHAYCRYCRQSFQIPPLCPECNKVSLRFQTPGTQKIESNLSSRFFGKRILRLDKDNIDQHHTIQLKTGDYDILIGTILALEHLDFNQVSLCVWLGLDSITNYPSFSSEEKALNLLSRIYEKMLSKDEVKELIIPSYSPQSELLRAVKNRHLAPYYQQMLKTRKQLSYPPFRDWLELTLSSNDEAYLDDRIKVLRTLLLKEKKLELMSIKKVPAGKAEGKKAFSLLLSSSEIIESSSFLCGIIDEYKKNEKISFKIKVLE